MRVKAVMAVGGLLAVAVCAAVGGGTVWGAAAGGATNGGLAGTPVKGPAETGKGPFLFTYFNGNGDGLHLAWSEDGYTFTPLNNDKPVMTGQVGGKLMRDPCARQGPDGVWHLVFTSGWYERGFGEADSNDLVHWSQQHYVEAMKSEPTAKNTWAPELFYDDQKQDWLIFWASTIPGKFTETAVAGGDKAQDGTILNHRMYCVTTKDFVTYSDTKLFYDPGFNCIDATIEKVGEGKYVMVIKDETKAPVARKNLRVATAEHPEGPWSKASDPVSEDWVEGPTVTKVGDGWNIYYDRYTAHKYGGLRTTDWKTFENIDAKVAFPNGTRHGTVVPVTPEQLAPLKKLGTQQ
jgi:hypothetical protein